MSKQVKVDRIVIKIGNKEISLDLDEAKELKEILADMFGGVKEIIREEHYHPYPYIWYEYKVHATPTWTIKYGDSLTTNTTTYSGYSTNGTINTLYLTSSK